jgi:hypothetical protein
MKTTFTFFFFFICCSLDAQQRFTLEANVGFIHYGNAAARLDQVPMMPGEIGGVKQVDNPIAGSLLFGWQFKERWVAKIGIGYQKRDLIAPTWIVSPNSSGVLATNTVEWLTLPVQLQYAFIQGKRTSVFVTGGLTLRNSTNSSKFFGGFDTKIPDALQTINNGHNMFLSTRAETAMTGTDSAISIFASYYQYPKWDVLVNAGIGASYQLFDKVALQIQAGYYFQASHRNFFGKYNYNELYRNGTLVGVFQDQRQSTRFRDNFFSFTAGIIYKLK